MGAWGFGPFDSDQGLDWVDGVTLIVTGERDMEKVDPANVDQAHVRVVMEDVLVQGSSDPHVMYAAVGLVAVGLHGGRTHPPLASYAPAGPPLLSEVTAAALAQDAREVLATLRATKEWVDTWNSPESLYAAMNSVEQALNGDNTPPDVSALY